MVVMFCKLFSPCRIFISSLRFSPPLPLSNLARSTSTADGGEPIEPEKAIMAMGKKDAEILNNKLEEQFKKALGGIGKGKVGLGFSPQLDPANKKFHIDASTSRSVKF